MPDPSDLLILRREVMGLFEHIQKMRREIASIHRPGATNDRFSAMSDELDAIVESTETATNTIMEAAETLDMITSGLASTVADEEAARKLGQVPDLVGQIFEACSFQDITGQRITKVVNSLQFIESQVHKLITMWGPEQIAEENVDDTPAMPATAPTTKDDYDSFLHGPALNGQGATQAEIDAMLAGTPAPATASPPPSQPPSAPPPPPASEPAPPPPPAKGVAKSRPAPPPPAPKPLTPIVPLGQADIDKLFD